MKRKCLALLLAGSLSIGSADFALGAVQPEMESPGEEVSIEEDGIILEENDQDASIIIEEQGKTEEALRQEEYAGRFAILPEVREERAGTGMIAPYAIYQKGSSFGRQGMITELNGSGTDGYSYGYHWASPETAHYFIDAGGMLNSVTYHEEEKRMYVLSYNHKGECTSSNKIKTPLPIWGGFYAAADGNFYVVTGQSNPKESSTKTVVNVTKYNSSWEKLGFVDIPGGRGNVFEGIKEPFDASSLRMTMAGDILVIHTGRTMFVSSDGLNHQSNITFMLDTEKMELLDQEIPYCSHSFNQFVKSAGNELYYLDHGDAYERGLTLSKYVALEGVNYHEAGYWKIFPFMGETGENYTGCEVTGFEISDQYLLTAGISVPHGFSVAGETGYDSSLNKNVFLLVTDRNTGQTRIRWITNHVPSGKNMVIEEPKLVQVGEDRYALLYSQETPESRLYYHLMDGEGNILLTKEYEGVTLQTNSQPILHNDQIFWLSGRYENGVWDNQHSYLYKIPLVTKPITGVTFDKKSLALAEDQKVTLHPSFLPEENDDVREVLYKSSNKAVASVSSKGVVTGLAEGTTEITARCGDLQAVCKVKVTIPNTNAKLAAPKVSTKQTRADKINLSWERCKGAKGYQIYSSTAKNGTYKKVRAVKSNTLQYDAKSTLEKTYYYKVRAYGINKAGKIKYSKWSKIVGRKAVVPKPSGVQCKREENSVKITWNKVEGATGYVIYRQGSPAKTLKVSKTSWIDPYAYDSDLGVYWGYQYYVKAYKTVNGKRVYSKSSKTVSFY